MRIQIDKDYPVLRVFYYLDMIKKIKEQEKNAETRKKRIGNNL